MAPEVSPAATSSYPIRLLLRATDRAGGVVPALIVALLLAGCHPGNEGQHRTGAAHPHLVRLTLSAEPPTVDWTLATDNVSITVIQNLMEGLTQFDDQLRVVPALAERWTISRDGRIYTFHLRRDARWTDGRPVTASDFVASWRRLLDPRTGAEYAYFLYDVENARDYNAGKITDSEKIGVRAPAPDRLEVRLAKPVVFFPALLTFAVTFPLRQDVIGRYGDHWTDPEHIVTLGAYRLAGWRHEYKLELEANPDFYEGRPAIDRLEMFIVNERTTALTLYETGDIDLVSLPPEAIPAYSGRTEFHRAPLYRGYYFGFNVTKRPFDDVRVRRAFSLAIDRRELPAILKGGETPTASWIPQGMFGANERIGLWYDPDRARALLAEAGYSGGRGFPEISAVFNTDPVNALIAENLQAQWKRTLGIHVSLDNVEWKVYLRRLATDPPALYRLGWGADYPDPDNFMVLFTSKSGNNHTRWGDRAYDALVARAAVERDPGQRAALYDEAQRILLERDAAIMPLFVAVQNLVIDPRLRGVRLDPMEILIFKHAQFEGSS